MTDCHIILPPVLIGIMALYGVVLHCYITGKLFHVTIVKAVLEAHGFPKGLVYLGSFKMYHVWMVNLKFPATQHCRLSIKNPLLKCKRRLAYHPIKAEIRLKLDWVSFHHSD